MITEWLKATFGNKQRRQEEIAIYIAVSASFGRRCGKYLLSEFVFQLLCQYMPKWAAEEVMTRYQRRCARGLPNADSFFQHDIFMALSELDSYATTSNSKRRGNRFDEAEVQARCEGIRHEFTNEVLHRFQRRRDRGCRKLEVTLQYDIAMAQVESEHYFRTFA